MGQLRELDAVDEATYAADEEAAAAAGVDLRGLRRPAALPFDTSRFTFREAVLACLDISSSGEDGSAVLEALRVTAESARKLSKRTGNRGPSTYYIQQWQTGMHGPSKRGGEFKKVYLDYLREVVLPHIGDPRGIVFQRDPTFRCHLAHGGEATGRRHNDSQYGHHRNELNFWLPITRAHASNSLYSESRPGAQDFEPLELEYGQCQRFWGAQCVHYTQPNETEITRISLDFRVVPRSCYVQPDGGYNQFCLGRFFAALDADGKLSYMGGADAEEPRLSPGLTPVPAPVPLLCSQPGEPQGHEVRDAAGMAGGASPIQSEIKRRLLTQPYLLFTVLAVAMIAVHSGSRRPSWYC